MCIRDSYQDGTTSERLDNWRGRYDAPPTSDKPWTGTTTFTEKPGLQLPDYTTTAGRAARGLAAPTEPTPQERALHELTHIPYCTWCSHCVRAKAKQNASRTVVDKVPVIQLDYCFMHTAEETGTRVTV